MYQRPHNKTRIQGINRTDVLLRSKSESTNKRIANSAYAKFDPGYIFQNVSFKNNDFLK
jgi:hypothetical protein